MFRKSLMLTTLIVLAALIPLQVHAGGDTYTIDKGDSVEKLAALCGATASTIYATKGDLQIHLVDRAGFR